jgi:hypothetical protein
LDPELDHSVPIIVRAAQLDHLNAAKKVVVRTLE